MRRRVIILFLFLALMNVAVFYVLALYFSPRELVQNDLERIESGMTYAEVEAIIGPPSTIVYGDASSNPTLIWRGNNCKMRLTVFDGKVHVRSRSGAPPSRVYDKLLQVVGWQEQ